MTGPVRLEQLDEERLGQLLAVAVADAVPEDVMPPVTGPPGWTAARQEAFLAWHRARRPGLSGPLREATFAITRQQDVVGSARLAVRDGQDTLETGMWLARSHRGHGTGTAALRMVLVEAARSGARVVVAHTRAHNTAALAVLRRNGATLTPWEGTAEVRAVWETAALLPSPPSGV
ncbi:GNAT family N-acetyltransferase [Streptomyces albus]|uniref:GNAT family N-acetyltransferase n=1 Tax=Streptomyces albus TaxID=1888 RepID=UPI0036F86081